MSKNVVEPEGHKWRHNMAHTLRMLDNTTRTYTHANAHAPGKPLARKPGHAHSGKYVIFIVFPRQQMIRERASVLRYTYIICIVKYESRK
jgi:hypothetical protein